MAFFSQFACALRLARRHTPSSRLKVWSDDVLFGLKVWFDDVSASFRVWFDDARRSVYVETTTTGILGLHRYTVYSVAGLSTRYRQ